MQEQEPTTNHPNDPWKVPGMRDLHLFYHTIRALYDTYWLKRFSQSPRDLHLHRTFQVTEMIAQSLFSNAFYIGYNPIAWQMFKEYISLDTISSILGKLSNQMTLEEMVKSKQLHKSIVYLYNKHC